MVVLQGLGGAVAEVPKLATAAANLRTAHAILILRANSKNATVARAALSNVGGQRRKAAVPPVPSDP